MSDAIDPSASAREWAALDPAFTEPIAAELAKYEQRNRNVGCDGFAGYVALARRVLADAPALLARMEEAEALLEKALDDGCMCDDETEDAIYEYLIRVGRKEGGR